MSHFLLILYFFSNTERDMVSRVLTALTKQTKSLPDTALSLSLLKLEDKNSTSARRQHISNVLQSIPKSMRENNFIVISSWENMETIMELAKNYELVNIVNKWFYVIPDTTANNTDINSILALLREGDNVSFLYNNTNIFDSCKVRSAHIKV